MGTKKKKKKTHNESFSVSWFFSFFGSTYLLFLARKTKTKIEASKRRQKHRLHQPNEMGIFEKRGINTEIKERRKLF